MKPTSTSNLNASMHGTREAAIFTTLSVPKAVMALVVPTVISQIIMVIYNLADTYFVGQTNNASMVAALSVTMPVFVIMAAVANLFGIGGVSLISRSIGEGKYEKARHTFAFVFWGSIIAAFLYALFIWLFHRPIIELVGGTEDTFEYIRQYMMWTMVIGAIPTILNNVFGHLIRSVGASRQASIGMSLGGLLNLVLDPLFMFVILPKGNEVVGAAIATMLSNVVATAYFFIFVLRNQKKFPIFSLSPRDISVKDGIASEVMAIGLPAALGTLLAMISNIFGNVLVVGYGTAAVAGMGIAKRIGMISFNITMGLTQGVLPLLGFSYAAKNFKRMNDAIKFTAALSLIFSIVCLIGFQLFSTQLVTLFIKDSATVAFGDGFLKILSIAIPLSALCYLITAIFQATGQKMYSFVITILRKGIVDIPLMFLLRELYLSNGVMAATPVADTIVTVLAIVLLVRFLNRYTHPKILPSQ